MADDQTIEELTGAVQALREAIKQGKTVDPKEVDRLDKALKNAARGSKAQSDAQKIQTEATNKNTKGMGRFAGGISNAATRTANLAAGMAGAASDIRENRESFTSLNPAIKLTGDAISKAGSLTGGVVDALGDALSGIPVVGGLIGGLVSGVGKITAALSEAAGNIINTVGPMLTAELERASKAYRQAGQVGALGAEGLSGLANQAIDAGLSFSTFAGVINKTAPELVFALGNSADAAKTLASTSKEMVPFRRNLLALGVTVEQQNELTAGYIGLQSRLNRGETRNAAALAQGSQNYIKNLTELSKLTGKSVSEQQKEIDGQMRNVRAAAALREVQRKLGGQAGQEAFDNITGVTAVLAKRAPTIAKGFQDALGGNLITAEAKQFQQSVGAAGMEIINQLKSGQIDRDTALAKIQEASSKRYDALGGDKFAMAVGGAGTAVDGIILDLQNLKFGAKFGEQIGKVEQQVDKTGKTTDGVTNSMINAQESMIKSAQALDALALQTTLPLAAKGIETFTKGMQTATLELMKYVGMSKEQLIKTLRTEAGLGKDTVEKGDVALTSGLGAGGGAAIGATIGSFILPGIGTAIGGGIGALVGLIAGNEAGKQGVGQDMVDFDDDSWLGSLFNKNPNIPKKAVGGPVQSGKSYVVGENGPELLMSGMNGNIVPNAGPAGGYSGMDLGNPASAISGGAGSMAATSSQAGGGSNNAIGEAQLVRLDTLITETSRANQINTKILQATRS